MTNVLPVSADLKCSHVLDLFMNMLLNKAWCCTSALALC